MTRWCIVLAALLGVGVRSAAASDDLERALRRVYPALVRIYVVKEEADAGRMKKERAAGSGVIIRKEGYIITNHHVAGRARRLFCRLADGEEVEAELVGTDALSDIAVIRLLLDRRKSTAPLPVAEFGDSDRLAVGDPVLAMGSPGGVAQSVTRGIVSNTALILPGGLRLDGEDVGSLVRWIAHDARIYSGNSGGPLVTLDGRIVGINEVGFAGLGGAIPGNLARSVAAQIIERGSVERSWIGVTAQPRLKGSSAEAGIFVGAVLPASPAAEVGLRPGDLILGFDGVAVDGRMPEDIPVFNAVVLSTPVGKTSTVEVLRNGERLRLSLVTRPREPARAADEEFREWGFTGRNLTFFSAMELLRDTTDGILISSVQPGGPADRAEPQLRAGDVLVEVEGRPVRNIAELRERTLDRVRGRSEPVRTVAAFERGLGRYLAVVQVGLPRDLDRPERSRKPDFASLLQPVSHELGEALGLGGARGVRVAYVFPGRAADKAGLKVGDIVTRFDGEPVRAPRPEDVADFVQSVRRYRIGATVPLEVIRDGQPRTISMTLEEAAETAEDPERHADPNFDFAVRELTMTDRALVKIPEDVCGVLVEQVEPASVAALAELRTGDLLLSVDGHPTPDVGAARRALEAAARARARYVTLFVRRGAYTRYVELEPDWNRSGSAADAPATKETHP